ncbi:hypothetical protein PHLGIDRAFT_270711 [Phlebiopsis gigantea 11061_1 CR5-6]|uniref:Uncharacterized protein n=1 Tax=Phlebiopsis gigantea (strain 11061_1 CR5-6) TaxID=745531 RepID=A0A0C3NEA6_PHLG1|nr:hypothetical protein PHLGIDRAFT_270711 [Phlebiopsis gigantea 11061_1 CR5-6]
MSNPFRYITQYLFVGSRAPRHPNVLDTRRRKLEQQMEDMQRLIDGVYQAALEAKINVETMADMHGVTQPYLLTAEAKNLRRLISGAQYQTELLRSGELKPDEIDDLLNTLSLLETQCETFVRDTSRSTARIHMKMEDLPPNYLKQRDLKKIVLMSYGRPPPDPPTPPSEHEDLPPDSEIAISRLKPPACRITSSKPTQQASLVSITSRCLTDERCSASAVMTDVVNDPKQRRASSSHIT